MASRLLKPYPAPSSFHHDIAPSYCFDCGFELTTDHVVCYGKRPFKLEPLCEDCREQNGFEAT